MPSQHQHGSDKERPEFLNIKEDHGEDPARFLCRDDTSTARMRIKGIQDLALLNAWRAVELRLFDGGRPGIMHTIERRRRELKEEAGAYDTSDQEQDQATAVA